MKTTGSSTSSSDAANSLAIFEQLKNEILEVVDKLRRSGHSRANDAIKELCNRALRMMEGIFTDNPDVTAARYHETRRLLDSANALLKSIGAGKSTPTATTASRALPTRAQAPAVVAPKPMARVAKNPAPDPSSGIVIVPSRPERRAIAQPRANTPNNRLYNSMLQTAKEIAAELLADGKRPSTYQDDRYSVRGWEFYTFSGVSGEKQYGSSDWEEWWGTRDLVLSTDGDLYEWQEIRHEYSADRSKDGRQHTDHRRLIEPANMALLANMNFGTITEYIKRLPWTAR